MDYRKYLAALREEAPCRACFLVSGEDAHVRRTVGGNLLRSCYERGRVLFLVDNTRGGRELSGDLGGYRLCGALDGQVSLCAGLLEPEGVRGVSRLRSALGFPSARAMQVLSYLRFVRETETRLGNRGPLTPETLETYGGTVLVRRKLERLARQGGLSRENCDYLLGRYSEVSAAAADFEGFLALLAPFLGGERPAPGMAVHLPLGELAADPELQETLCRLLLSCLREDPLRSAVLVLDEGNGQRSWLMDLLRDLPEEAEAHLFTRDAFSLGEAERGLLMRTFPVRIYSRHEDMTSCGRIAACCGEVDVVKRSSSVTVDRRWRANSAWDLLLGNDRTETRTANAPVRQERFRKEMINAMAPGTGIVDCGGNRVLFSF